MRELRQRSEASRMTPPIITPELLALSEGVAELFPLETPTQLRKYMVLHKRGFVVEAQFEAQSIDSATCVSDNPAPEGCKCEVMPLEKWKDREWERKRINAIRDIEQRGMWQ
jgi:hypothetical protein